MSSISFIIGNCSLRLLKNLKKKMILGESVLSGFEIKLILRWYLHFTDLGIIQIFICIINLLKCTILKYESKAFFPPSLSLPDLIINYLFNSKIVIISLNVYQWTLPLYEF